MSLTAWNAPGGPGADYRTRDIIVADCNGVTVPQKTYRVMGDSATTIVSTVQTDPLSDDRFQRVMRVHLSSPQTCQPLPNGSFCAPQPLYINDLASVWGVHMNLVATNNGTAVTNFQLRIIQAVNGSQIKRATLRYKGAGVTGGVIQLHGWESTDLEIWGWADPEEVGSAGLIIRAIFEVTVRLDSSSGNDTILGDDWALVP